MNLSCCQKAPDACISDDPLVVVFPKAASQSIYTSQVTVAPAFVCWVFHTACRAVYKRAEARTRPMCREGREKPQTQTAGQPRVRGREQRNSGARQTRTSPKDERAERDPGVNPVGFCHWLQQVLTSARDPYPQNSFTPSCVG